MKASLQEINALAAANRIDEAIEMCNTLLGPDAMADTMADHDVLVARGRLRWRVGDRGGAVTDYNRALRLRPDGPAAALLEHSNDILDFYNPDMLNP